MVQVCYFSRYPDGETDERCIRKSAAVPLPDRPQPHRTKVRPSLRQGGYFAASPFSAPVNVGFKRAELWRSCRSIYDICDIN